MRVEAATPETALAVAEQMREADLAEFLAVSFARDRDELARHLAGAYGSHAATLCVHDDAGPVVIGGLVEWRPNVATLLLYATDRFPGIAFDLTRFLKQRLFPAYRERGVHRLEAVSMEGHDEAHRWIEVLGLSRECVLPRYGRGGETFIQFAWTT